MTASAAYKSNVYKLTDDPSDEQLVPDGADAGLLTEAEQAELATLLTDQLDGEKLYDFICRINPGEPPPQHLRLLCNLFQRARRERIKVCVSWPPRHAKTVTVIKAIVWWLTLYPADTLGYVSYSDTQARKKSRIARAYALGAGVAPNPEKWNVAEWRTARGGGLIAGGSKGGFTGEGIDGFVVVDDPYKDMQDATSEKIRERVREWFAAVVLTRLMGASVIVIHTRWHEDDLIGWLVRDKGWEYINVEAIAPDDRVDPIGRAPGEALWPDRFPAINDNDCPRGCGHYEHLLSKKIELGSYVWSALYSGRPVPKGGALFQMAWFTHKMVDPSEVPKGMVRCRGWDLAATEGGTGPRTAGVKFARAPDNRIFIEHAMAKRLGPHGVRELLKSTAANDGPNTVQDIPKDPGQAGKAQTDDLARNMVTAGGGATRFSPEWAKKEVRAHPFAAACEAGIVYIVRGDWDIQGFLDELCRFPWGELNDYVDAGSRGYHRVIKLPRTRTVTGGRLVAAAAGPKRVAVARATT